MYLFLFFRGKIINAQRDQLNVRTTYSASVKTLCVKSVTIWDLVMKDVRMDPIETQIYVKVKYTLQMYFVCGSYLFLFCFVFNLFLFCSREFISDCMFLRFMQVINVISMFVFIKSKPCSYHYYTRQYNEGIRICFPIRSTCFPQDFFCGRPFCLLLI